MTRNGLLEKVRNKRTSDAPWVELTTRILGAALLGVGIDGIVRGTDSRVVDGLIILVALILLVGAGFLRRRSKL